MYRVDSVDSPKRHPMCACTKRIVSWQEAGYHAWKEASKLKTHRPC